MKPTTYRAKALLPHIWPDDVPLINVLADEIRAKGYAVFPEHNNTVRRLVRYGYLENYRKVYYTWTDDGARLPALLKAAQAAPQT